MSEFKIFSDSSLDMPDPLVNQWEIIRIPYSVTFDKETYYKEHVDLSPDQFYEKIHSEKMHPSTSLPPIQEYTEAFLPVLKEGMDVLCFTLSAKFSGSYQSALNAKMILEEEFPDRNIVIIDSILATAAQGLLVYEACLMKKAGYSLKDVAAKVEELKHTARINFTVDSLDFLQKGGRIGKAGALAGTLLNIKPIITLENGELHPSSKVRGKKKALNHIIEKTWKESASSKDKYVVGVIYGTQKEDADYVYHALENEGILPLPDYFQIGLTIGTHAGPTAVGIAYIKNFDA